MPQLEQGRLTNPARRSMTKTAKRKKTTKSKVMRDLEQKNASMAKSLSRLRKMNPGKTSIGQAAIHAGVAGAGGVIGSALAAVVTPDDASPMVKGAVRVGIGMAAAVAGEMYGGKSDIARAAAYGACGALVDRGLENFGVYEKIGINMDGGSYYMGAADYDDLEYEDDADFETLDNDGMRAIPVTSGPLDQLSGTPGQSGLKRTSTFARVMDSV